MAGSRPAGRLAVDLPPATDAKSPASRHLLDDWLRKLYQRAGITPKVGGMWHPIRRKFTSERKGLSAVDVAHFAGWRDLRTLQGIYQQPDVDSLRIVAEAPTNRIVMAL